MKHCRFILIFAFAFPCLAADALKDLESGDAMTREAAIRSLAPHAKESAMDVVKLFEKGNLTTRLAVIELLETWHAPVEGIDPWNPKTITPQKLEELRAWGANPPTTSPAIDLAAARREIAAMIGSADEKEVRIIRERLARAGPPLLDEVRAQIKSAPGEQARARLIALRYRLGASDRLATEWKNGFERIASVDASVRHAALNELETLATADDAAMLLEMFSDSDPLVREQSLRMLNNLAGEKSLAALVKLLNDPEPNVRAAVLKQLVENPPAGSIDAIIAYVGTEKDSDLVVHAVRVLRVSTEPASFECLKLLLEHESWRVRAEAAEAIGEKALGRHGQIDTVSAYAAMIKLLDDPDGFVVSRAVAVLARANLQTAVAPMLKAAQQHPELTLDILTTLTKEDALGPDALPLLTKLASSEDPKTRVAAVAAIGRVAPQTSGPALAAMLKDKDAAVRAAAAWACLAAVQSTAPEDGYVTHSKFFGFGTTRVKVDEKEWFDDFRAGKNRPDWAAQIVPSLLSMLQSADSSERIAAAAALVPLNQQQQAVSMLVEAVKNDHKLVAQVDDVLPWAEWDKRLELFNALREAAGGDEHEMSAVVTQMVRIRDDRVADLLWNSIGQSDSLVTAEVAYRALIQFYTGNQYYNVATVPIAQRKAGKEAALKMMTSGTELQRSIAMAVLLTVWPEDLPAVAQPIIDNSTADQWLRMDALQLTLLAIEKSQGETLAVKYVSDPVLRKISLLYLAAGPGSLREIRGSIGLYYFDREQYVRSTGQSIEIRPPAGLTAEMVQPALSSGDAQLSACAGYLLVLLKDPSGMGPLMQFWTDTGKHDDDWTRLVFRAIAFSNDDNLVPVLDDIFANHLKESYRIGEFYWTIRSMTGEKALALRKRIRNEVGMDKLR